MKISLMVLSLSLGSHNVSHQFTNRYGTFLQYPLGASKGFPWSEITIYPGELFSFKKYDSTCEDTFGHGKYRQSGDTLILSAMNSWSTLDCKQELTENLILNEKKYLTRSIDYNSFQISPVPDSVHPKQNWITFKRFGKKMPPPHPH